MPKIFVSIIDYNGEKDTLSCLESLDNQNIERFSLDVVVIDNASKKNFVTDHKYHNFKLKIIRNDENLGFSGGHNQGIEYALENGADYILILNNDVVLDKNLILGLLKTFDEVKDCGIVSPKIYFAKGFEFHKDRYEENEKGRVFWFAGGKMDWRNVLASHKGVDEVDHGQYENLESTDFASGCCEMIKKEVFSKIGKFDERYFLYYEDNDLSQRAKKAEFEIYYQPKSIVWHINANSAGGSGSSLQDYYITRNRLLFGFRFAPFRAKFALFRESLMILFSGRKWQKSGVSDYYLRIFGKGSYK